MHLARYHFSYDPDIRFLNKDIVLEAHAMNFPRPKLEVGI